MNTIKFTEPRFDICSISKCDVITTSYLSSNSKLDDDGYGTVYGLDDYGM